MRVLNLFAVYIPPDANTESATTMLKDFVESAILKQPDSAAIMVGDFNNARQSTSSLYQYVRVERRENSQLDLCYSKVHVSDACKLNKLPPLSTSDHAAVQLVPIYH